MIVNINYLFHTMNIVFTINRIIYITIKLEKLYTNNKSYIY